jgi:hypothetical protein
MLNIKQFIQALTIVFIFSAVDAFAQGSAFVYQGKLQDGGAAANGTYQFEFKLYDAVAGGNQVGQTLSDIPATVTSGIFTVNLDFGAASYTGAARFLEISVRLNGSGQPYTNLNPRQEITSAPYAVRALNANQANQATTANTANTATTANFATDAGSLGGIAANQYVLTTDPRLQPQAPGNFIQNSTNQQPTSNFNISGEGKADKFTAATQYNIGLNRVLAAGNGNLFVGFGTGGGGASGGLNTFVGNNAGMNTSTGTRNAFSGAGAGLNNTTGSDNSYFGSGSGLTNQTSSGNSFFGANSGNLNTAANNSFFGANSGKINSTGTNNAFFGFETGMANQSGAGNSIFGAGAGKANVGGDQNSFFGRNAGTANNEGNFNSFFGSGSGQGNTTGIGNSFFGESTGILSNGSNNSFFGKGAGLVSTTGGNNTFVGYTAGVNNTTGSNNTLLGANAQVASNSLQFATAIGAGAVVDASNRITLGRDQGQDGVWIWGKTIAFGGLSLGTMEPGASFALCGGGGSGTSIGFCSSSIRYKENVEDYTRGLDLITKLRPVTFDWKKTGERDLGFVAEEVGEAEPLLNVVYKGQIEGVKYAQITTALVNAVKEQQEQIRRQQEQIEALKALVCAANPNVAVCQPAQKEIKP